MNSIEEKQSIKYLLGELSEQEQSQLEERFFSDAGLSELLSEAEDDLVDRYVRGELSANELERVESHFLISERRRRKVDLARALFHAERAAGTSAAAAKPKPIPLWESITLNLLNPRPALSFAMGAAALLLLFASAWLFREVRHLQNEVGRTEAERRAVLQQQDRLNAQTTEQRRQNEQLTEQNQVLEQELAALREQVKEPVSGAPAAALSVAFLLVPGDRSSQAANTLTIPSGARTVNLQIRMNRGDEYPTYRATLQTSGGNLVRSWNAVKPASTKRGRSVILPIRSDSLTTATQYEVALSGVDRSGGAEAIGYYYFSVLGK